MSSSALVHGLDGPDLGTEPVDLGDAPGTGGHARLTLYWNGGSGVWWIGPGERLTIGRSAACDICVDDPSVSREHVAVTFGSRMGVEDLGSRNGTRVHDRCIARGADVAVDDGDVVVLGSAVLLVQHATKHTSKVPPAAVSANRLIDLAARSDIGVLLLGETGVGKSVLARSIHDASKRAPAPFVRVDCPALPETLLESELFGHEKGAFTGAVRQKEGLLESAPGGTIFLDEIGDIPLTTQAKLLTAIETREVLRIGGLRARRIDVRFVSATNRDLDAAVASGLFRRDLLFRLRGLPITIPPLRARTAEIPVLAQHFLDEARRRSGDDRKLRLSNDALLLLTAQHWPGNLRELRHVIDRAALLCDGDRVLVEHVLFDGNGGDGHAPAPSASSTRLRQGGLRTQLETFERGRVLEALDSCGGNQTRAAQLLGISRRALIMRLEVYGVARPRKRAP